MQSKVIVLGTFEEDCPSSIKRDSSIPMALLIINFVSLLFLMFVQELNEMNISDVAEQEVVEGSNVIIGTC